MASLREMGCKFALDDFGSGLSSFGYLKKLPVDFLKIDGMFIRDLLTDKTDRIFVKSIIDIAHTLNIKTVAEFIENDELLDVVRDLGPGRCRTREHDERHCSESRCRPSPNLQAALDHVRTIGVLRVTADDFVTVRLVGGRGGSGGLGGDGGSGAPVVRPDGENIG